jgi:sugar phosphate isomerase/epimerase
VIDPKRLSFHPSIAGHNDAQWPQSAAIAAGAGFVVTDLALEEFDGATPGQVQATLAEHGLRPGAVPLPVEFRRDEETFRTGIADLDRRARLAAAVGVRTMYRSLPAAAEQPRNVWEAVLRRRLAECATVLHDHCIALALEILGPLHRRREAPHEFIWRLPDCAAFATSVAPSVGVLVDSWHWHHGGGTAAEIADVASLILHAHLADAPDLPPEVIRDQERVLPGDGVADVVAFLAALDAAGYRGPISLEIPGGWHPSPDPTVNASAARRAAEQVLTSW